MAFGSFEQDDEGGPIAEINMVPLIDVMLVLLIIFLVTAPLLTQAMKVNLPKADSVAAEPAADLVTLVVDAQGNTWWNQDALSRDALDARLRELARRAPDTPVRLRADRDADWAAIAPIFALAAHAGLSKLGVETDPSAP